jgi:cbb3-type cytochrome oxidase subunit 3
MPKKKLVAAANMVSLLENEKLNDNKIYSKIVRGKTGLFFLPVTLEAFSWERKGGRARATK